jgi:hypothetical protein
MTPVQTQPRQLVKLPVLVIHGQDVEEKERSWPKPPGSMPLAVHRLTIRLRTCCAAYQAAINDRPTSIPRTTPKGPAHREISPQSEHKPLIPPVMTTPVRQKVSPAISATIHNCQRGYLIWHSSLS